MAQSLLVIDLQNDYFPGGAYPLWNTDATLHNIALHAVSTRVKLVPSTEAF